MAAYKLFFKKSVQKDLNAISKAELKRILKRIKGLTENPRPAGCEKLTGQERYRLRHGRYRILYSIQDDDLTVWVVKVGHRERYLSMRRTSRCARPDRNIAACETLRPKVGASGSLIPRKRKDNITNLNVAY